MSQEGIKHIQKQHDKFVKDNHPAAKHLKKILDNPTNKTNVLKNGIAAHCFECSHDPIDAGGSHPKKCTIKKCPFWSLRPGASYGDEKPKKELSPERKSALQANAEKARSGRKLTVKEAMELLDEKCNGQCKCKGKNKKKDCECGGKCGCDKE
jgi:hypothetical protein